MANDYSIVLSARLDEAQARAKIVSTLKKIEQNATVNVSLKNETLSSNIQKAQLRVENLRTKYSAFVTDPKLQRAWRTLFDESQLVKTKEQLVNLNAKVGVFEQQLEKAGKRTRSFGAEMKNNIFKMANWMVLGSALAAIMRSIAQIYENVKAVDKAMTELKKVTNETSTAYNKFLDEAAVKAAKLSAGVSELVEAVANFSRLGYSMEDATQLAEVAIMYKNVGDEVESVDQATRSIISTLKAWNLETSESMRIVDIFNIVGNKFAVSSGQVGDAMQRAGASLAVANNSIEQSVALWTAMNEILQDGDVASTSLRFIAARMRNTAGQLQEMDIDADGAAESITKLRSEILDLTGVDLMSTNDEFRSTFDVLKDIAGIWSELSGKDQADVIRLLAGTRQQTAFSALMTNWATAERVVATATESMGSATAEYAEWQKSIEAHSKSLSAAWEAFSVNFLESGTVIDVIDILKLLVEVLGFVEEHIGLLNVALIVLAGVAGAKTVLGLTGLANALYKVLTGMGLATGAATTLSMALSVMIPVAAIIGAIAIFNKVNVTLDEQKQKVADLADEYSAVVAEIESLSAKKITSPLDTPLTEAEQKRLEYLEKYRADLEYVQALETRKAYSSEFFGNGNVFSSGIVGKVKSSANAHALGDSTPAAADVAFYGSTNLGGYSAEQLQAAYDSLFEEMGAAEDAKAKLEAALLDPAVVTDPVLTQKIKDAITEVDGYIGKYETALANLVVAGNGAVKTSTEQVAAIKELEEQTQETTDETNKFLESAQAANNELEAAVEAYKSLSDAVEEYNDNGYVTDDTLAALETRIPGVISLLYDESGQLRNGAAAALQSTDAMFAFLKAQTMVQLAAAQADYTNLVNELGRASAAAIAAQQNIDNLQALLNLITGAQVAGGKDKKSKGGGGSSSIYSKEYKNAKEYTEHMIKLSELRQERMEEESDEYEQESQNQILYYQQLVDATVAEMQRLAAEGYDITNEQYRKLLEDFESYQNAIYQIAYAAWKQQQNAAKEAIQDQIDAENERWEARKKQLDFERDAQEALLDLENEYLDVIGEITDEISELDKQLATALSYPIGSDLNLFTQEEHDNLVSQLEDISDEAASLYEEYQARISDVTVDTEWELQSITDEFERQYELLLKQYEISKADLAVARARRELENVLNERNVAMLVNGVWTWVADPESVKAAVEAVYDAEKDAEDALRDLINTQRTQAIEEAISNIEAQTAVEEAAHDKIIEGLEEQLEAIDEMDFVFDEFIATFMSGTDALKAAIAELGKIEQPTPDDPPGKPNSYTPTGVDKAGNPKPGNSGPTTTAYADGGVADYTGYARMDGSSRAAEVVFNSANAKKLYDLVYNTDDLVAMVAGRIGRSIANINPSFGGAYGSISGSADVTNIYIDGVKIGGQDGELLKSIFQRNMPLVKNRG